MYTVTGVTTDKWHFHLARNALKFTMTNRDLSNTHLNNSFFAKESGTEETAGLKGPHGKFVYGPQEPRES